MDRFLGGTVTPSEGGRDLRDVKDLVPELEPVRKPLRAEINPKLRDPEYATSRAVEGFDPRRIADLRDLITKLWGSTDPDVWGAALERIEVREAAVRDLYLEEALLAQVDALRARRCA